MLVWGWGQAALGRPVALGLGAVQAGAIVALLAAALTIGLGTGVELVFIGLAGLAVAWGAVALDAYRRAASRRATSDGPGGDGGAIELLWLAPPIIVTTALLWGLGGGGASSSSVTSRYVSAWQHDRAAQAAGLFTSPPASAVLKDAWERQEALLRGELIKASAAAGPDAGIDPARPFESLSFTIDPDQEAEHRASMRVQIVWWETVQGTFLGVIPTTSRRQVTYEDIGAIEVDRLDMTGPLGASPAGREWRIERVDLLGVEVRPSN